jgi:hypothetical protein
VRLRDSEGRPQIHAVCACKALDAGLIDEITLPLGQRFAPVPGAEGLDKIGSVIRLAGHAFPAPYVRETYAMYDHPASTFCTKNVAIEKMGSYKRKTPG